MAMLNNQMVVFLCFPSPRVEAFFLTKQDSTETSSPAGNVPSTASVDLCCQHGMTLGTGWHPSWLRVTGGDKCVNLMIIMIISWPTYIQMAAWKMPLCLLISACRLWLVHILSVPFSSAMWNDAGCFATFYMMTGDVAFHTITIASLNTLSDLVVPTFFPFTCRQV